MVPPDDSFGVNKHVATQLKNVAGRCLQATTTKQQFQVNTPGFRAQNGRETSAAHAEAPVQLKIDVCQQRPGPRSFGNIKGCPGAGLESDRDYAEADRLDGGFVLLQLQQVFAARQSAEMAMESQQEPVPLVVFQAVCAAVDVRESKIDGRKSVHVVCHCWSNLFRFRNTIEHSPGSHAIQQHLNPVVWVSAGITA